MRKSVVRLIAIIAWLPCIASAQQPSGSATPTASVSPAASATPSKIRALTIEERRVLITVGQRAQHDGRVMAAQSRVHQAAKAFNDAMVAKDPSVSLILQKLNAENAPGGRHIRLTADEREQLRIAREGMKGTPQDDALQKASAEYRNISSSIMAAAEPSIGPIVQRLPKSGSNTGPRHVSTPNLPLSTPDPAASPSGPAS